MLERLFDATDNLIEQQFYRNGTDKIIGRTPEISVKIRNSGQIIKKFKELFYENIYLFLKGNYLEFLLPFKKIKGIDETCIIKVHTEFERKVSELHQSIGDFDVILLYTIILSNFISKIRNLHFNDSIEEVFRRTKKKASYLSKKEVQEQLDRLFMKNNSNVSILYNLSYLDALAESFSYRKVARTCKILKSKYINLIVNLIVSPNN
jgi:hypothetical protein